MAGLFQVARHLTNSLEAWYTTVPVSFKQEIPLLRSLENFTNSLPVNSDHGKRYEKDIYVHERELGVLVDALERKPRVWAPIKFMASPPGYGKTLLGLCGFLESTLRKEKIREPFQCYIYLAFSGNGGRHYQPSPRSLATNTHTARNQGAEFTLQCITDALNKPWESNTPRVIPLNDEPRDAEWSKEALGNTLAKLNGRVLVHVDEHRKMCDASDSLKVAEAFTLGALNVLARTRGVVVLATDTKMPLLPAYRPSLASWIPVSTPSLDIDAAIADSLALSRLQARVSSLAEDSKLDQEQARLWEILRFRLALRLRTLSLSKTDLDSQFRAASEVSSSDLTQALVACCELCDFKLAAPTRNENAVKLLCGVSLEYDEEFHLKVPDQLVVYDWLVTCDLKCLLEMSFPDEGRVFDNGREIMANTVCSRNLRTAHQPLKAAFVWTLSTQALYSGVLDFTSQSHLFRCRQLKSGRIFPSHEAKGHSLDWLSLIEPATFYYASEGKDNELAHPLFDCWFRNDDGDVVLCAVASGHRGDSEEKAAKLAEWIKGEQAKITGGEPVLYGAVFAPHVEGWRQSLVDSEDEDQPSSVEIVCGAEATKLLGGLGQIIRWM